MDKIPSSALQFILDTIRPHKWRMVLFFGLSLLGIFAWAASPFAIRGLINELTKAGRATNAAWWYIGAFVFLRLCDEWFWRIAENDLRKIKPSLIEGVRTKLFDYTLHKPYNYFVNASSGQLGHWINQTTTTVSDAMDTTTWGVWPQAAGLILSALFLFLAHWLLGVLFIIWMVSLFSFTVKRGKGFSLLVEKESQARSEAAGHVVDALSNHLSVRVFNSRQRELALLHSRQNIIKKRWDASWRFAILTNLVKGHSIAFAGGICLSVMLWLFGRHQITVGDVALFIAYFSAASSTVWELSWQLDSYYRNFGTIENTLKGLGAGEPERVDSHTKVVPNKASIQLRDLSFSYPDQPDRIVLSNVNLDIKAGERVGLVGHSGAGKSTLVGLLLGFYAPLKGDLLLGDVHTSAYSPAQMRQLIAYVPQDTNLFNRTIEQNIAYARPDATKEEIVQAAKDAEAYDFISNLPNGFDTMIGERGVKLSDGQRQRIAIARALLKDAPILLLDEATSALDSVSEQLIQKAFAAAMKQRTAVVVAHRLSTLQHLDKIVVFDKGTIAEQGTHAQLLAAGGVYADLWRRQKDGFIAE